MKDRMVKLYPKGNYLSERVANVVKLEWGLKRTCQGCGSRFYDMCKSPIICPKCNAVFELTTTTTRSRRAKSAAVDEKAAPVDDLTNIVDLELGDDLAAGDTDALLEDADDLGEDLNEMSDVIDHVDESDDR